MSSSRRSTTASLLRNATFPRSSTWVVRLGVQTSDDFWSRIPPKMDQIVAELEGGADFAAARKWSEDSLRGRRLPWRSEDHGLGEDVVTALEGVEPGSRTKIVVGARDSGLPGVRAHAGSGRPCDRGPE